MAIKSKFFLSRLILRLYTRYLSSSYPSPSFSAVSPLILTNNPQPTVEKPPAQPQDTAAKPTSILDLKDHQTLFASLPTAKLLHASLNIHLASVEPLVDFGTWVMSAKLMAMKVARYLVLATISCTFYQHLCGGEGYKGGRDVYNKTITCWFERVASFRCGFTRDSEACDRNLERLLEAVDSAMSFSPSFASITTFS